MSDLVAEDIIVPLKPSSDGARIGIENDLIRVKAHSLMRRVGAMHAIGIELARPKRDAFLATGLIGQGNGDFLLTLKWSHLSGAAFGQTALHSKALFGADWRPFVFARPQLIPHDAYVSMELINLTAAPNAISVYLIGYKVIK